MNFKKTKTGSREEKDKILDTESHGVKVWPHLPVSTRFLSIDEFKVVSAYFVLSLQRGDSHIPPGLWILSVMAGSRRNGHQCRQVSKKRVTGR